MADDDARTRILQAATHLFAQRGYGSTSVREVVEAAGVTKPTLYYWFQSKEALYLEALKATLDGLHELVRDALERPGTLEDRLHGFLEQYIGGALAERDRVLLALKASHPSEPGRPEVDLAMTHLEAIEPLGRLFSEGVASGEVRGDIDPRFAVTTLIGAANLHLLAALNGVPLPADHARRILDIFFRGVAR